MPMPLWLDACSRHKVSSTAPWAAQSSSTPQLEKPNFSQSQSSSPSSPPPIFVYISRGELGWVCSWAAVPGRTPRTAGLAAPGSAFPASSLMNSGLWGWHRRGRRMDGSTAWNQASGSRKWVAGGDRVCFPCCCCPSVSTETFLLGHC